MVTAEFLTPEVNVGSGKSNQKDPSLLDQAMDAGAGLLDTGMDFLSSITGYGNSADQEEVESSEDDGGGGLLQMASDFFFGEEEEQEEETQAAPEPQTNWAKVLAAFEAGDVSEAIGPFLAMNAGKQAELCDTHPKILKKLRRSGDPAVLRAIAVFYDPKSNEDAVRLEVDAGFPNAAWALDCFLAMEQHSQRKMLGSKRGDALRAQYGGHEKFEAVVASVDEQNAKEWIQSQVGEALGFWESFLEERMERLGRRVRGSSAGDELDLAENRHRRPFEGYDADLQVSGSSAGTATVVAADEFTFGYGGSHTNYVVKVELTILNTFSFEGWEYDQGMKLTTNANWSDSDDGFVFEGMEPAQFAYVG